MNNKPKVFLREEKVLREIEIASAGKPSIDREFLEKWQRIISLIAKVIHMPAAIIMQITRDTANILISSDGVNNPFHSVSGQPLRSGLYCESELGRNGLLIENTGGEDGIYSAEYKPKMAARFGLPVLWPDDELFGTICVPDNKVKALKREYQDILFELKLAFERELAFLCYQQKLIYSAETDILTSVYNRRKMEDVLTREFDRVKRYAGSFSVTIMDLNDFKQINDTYGHDAGDNILKDFAQGINTRIRETDYFGRWGGDEFILVCPNADIGETQRMIARVRNSVGQAMRQSAAFTDFCFGVSQFKAGDQSYLAIVKRADEHLYKNKERRKIKSDDYA